MELPLFLTKRNKYALSILWLIVGAGLYLLTNHLLIYPPHLLPLTRYDRAIPFIPETVWVYNSEFFLYFAAYLFAKDMVNTNKYLYAFLSAQLISSGIFLFWPTTYPRELFPLPAYLDAFTSHVFAHLRDVDAPTNCMPSMHVCGVFISAFLFIDEQRKKLFWFVAWSVAIAISTLTTKQHYISDVVTGFLLAAILWVIFHRLVRYRKLAPVTTTTANAAYHA